jgi:hypothetical protein
MSLLAVQLNHPGSEKRFKLNQGYYSRNGILYREWNRDAIHYRKFIEQEGACLTPENKILSDTKLHFWGEWEGTSEFVPLPGTNPNGVHKPMHTPQQRGTQNTDPYVFGSAFYYAVCKQRGLLNSLAPGSLILFGSSYKTGFVLDTVFVVRESTSVHEVAANRAENLSKTYREATLEQLGDTYLNPDPHSALRLYESVMYADHTSYFSYVPCMPSTAYDGKGFKRLTLPYGDLGGWSLSSNPTGWKVLGKSEDICRRIYSYLEDAVKTSGFHKAIQLKEP